LTGRDANILSGFLPFLQARHGIRTYASGRGGIRPALATINRSADDERHPQAEQLTLSFSPCTIIGEQC
jgi:hypothetical protein